MSDEKNDGLTRRQVLGIGGAAASGAALVTSIGMPRAWSAPPEAALPQVPRKVLGKTGQDIPILLFGSAIRLDPRFDPKMAEALRFGVNYFDNADCYGGGSAELALASFLKRTKARDKVWITSKSDQWDPAGFAKTLDESLRKLETDRVDMYYLHGLDDAKYLNDDLKKKVAELKKSKKMRFFGFSCHAGNVAELMMKASTLDWVDSIMFRYNFRQYGDKELNAAIDACHKTNIGLIAMKTQGSEASFRDAWQKFEKTGKWTKHQAVLKAVWADERITAAVSSMTTFDELKQNIAAALDKTTLGALEWKAIEKYAQDTRGMSCSGCDHLCGPAVDAPVRIGDTMRFLMYHEVYGEQEKAQQLFAKLPQQSRRLSGVDFSPANRACPHGVDVVAQMDRAARIFHA